MNTLTRKQREIQQRKQLMLDIAEQLIDEDGHQALSMDRIAELSEYSKGTVYQHFPCKEEVLIAICQRSMGTLTELFERANRFDGRPRERIVAIYFAHSLYAALHTLQFCCIQIVKSASVKEKISEQSLATHLESERRIVGLVAHSIQDGISCGDLVLPVDCNPIDVVFGFWSSSYGGLLLQTYDIDFNEIGLPDLNASMRKIFQFTLDGMGWKPLSNNHDYAAVIERIKAEVFADECAQLAGN
jgi:AcrR family transcriptional regulator